MFRSFVIICLCLSSSNKKFILHSFDFTSHFSFISLALFESSAGKNRPHMSTGSTWTISSTSTGCKHTNWGPAVWAVQPREHWVALWAPHHASDSQTYTRSHKYAIWACRHIKEHNPLSQNSHVRPAREELQTRRCPNSLEKERIRFKPSWGTYNKIWARNKWNKR